VTTVKESIDRICVDTIRTLAIDAVQNANSGHPGLPLGAAPMAYALWQNHLVHDPRAPRWPDRDRFVLSAGHGSALLYCLLHLYGYELSLDELKAFRQWGSKTPGHPEFGLTPGVEATTGPLGQGTANAVGMAIAERALAARFNRPGHTIVDHFTYALVSDGDLMEGLSAEAASLAGHLRLGKLVYLYDSNSVSLDGPTSLSFSEDVARRYEAYGWRTWTVADGDHDLDALGRALREARADTSRPSLIVVKTTIGFGSPKKAGTSEAHGSPLGTDEVLATKRALGWKSEASFFVPAEARARFAEAATRGAAALSAWQARWRAWAAAHPDLASEWRRLEEGELPAGWDAELPRFEAGKEEATRVAGGKTLSAIAARVPELCGGDADLSVSTNTNLKGLGDFDGQSGTGRNMHFGVREHAMGSIANGIAYHGGLRPFVATFFCFSDYMRPAVRLAALSELPVIYVWTHDSIGLGEDGPTHQPVEHLAALRAMPGMTLLRPCDANETVEAWRFAMRHREGPVGLVLTRQKLPTLDRSVLAPASELARGAYVLAEASGGAPELLLVASGSEVQLALGARTELERRGHPTRVVSMPSMELFARAEPEWRERVLPRAVRARLAIEAGASFGWHRWVGDAGDVLCIDRFGASAPGDRVLREYGFTAEHVVEKAEALLAPRAGGVRRSR
jgi:transketolase